MKPVQLFVLIIFVYLLPITLALSCARGKFIKHGRCVPCPKGMYNEELNQTECMHCPEGTYNRFKRASSYEQCIECPSNTFSKRGATSCTPCPEETFSRKRFSQCMTCPPGKALSEYSECEKCPPAFYRPANAKPTRCLLCPSGTGSRRGATKCTKCPRGTFRDIQFISRKEMVGCRKCPKNSFADVTGSIQCKLCPLGSVAEEKGAKKCTSCPPGTFRSRVNQKKCKPCPVGTISKGKMPAGCKNPEKRCPVNTFEDRNGECRACMPGERLVLNRKKCVPCGKREVSLGGVSTKCETCPRGQRPASANSIFEKSLCECEEGTESDGAGGCKKCPKGTEWDIRPAGAIWYTFQRRDLYDEPSCENCEPGFFSDEKGKTECKPCPLGTYINIEGSASCIPCPSGFISPPGDPTDDEEELDAERSNCLSERTACSLGERSDRRNEDGECISTKKCPPNRFFNSEPYRMYCDSCWYDEFYDPRKGKCINCPAGSTRRGGGAFRRCKVCPKGAQGYDGRCDCTGLYEDNRKGGCRKCKEGEISTRGKCAPCGEDSFYKITKYGPECKKCTGDTIKLREQHRWCTKCRDGFKKEVDVFGREVNNCVPKDLYPVSR